MFPALAAYARKLAVDQKPGFSFQSETKTSNRALNSAMQRQLNIDLEHTDNTLQICNAALLRLTARNCVLRAARMLMILLDGSTKNKHITYCCEASDYSKDFDLAGLVCLRVPKHSPIG
jgi:hypothetical protein